MLWRLRKATNISLELFGMMVLVQKKLMFLTQIFIVFLSPFTSEYSQERIQKKNAKTWSQAMVTPCGSLGFARA